MILDVNEVCSKIEPEIITFIHNVINVIKIGVPIALVIFGMIDLGKGVIASKEDEIKKGQKDFIKRILAGVIVFFIISITQLVMSVIDRNGNGEFWACANGIMNGQEKIKRQSNNTNEIVKDCCAQISGEYVEENGRAHCNYETGLQSERYYQCYREGID